MLENTFAQKSYLVIDDFGDMRTMIKGLIRALGGTDIDAAREGREAISMMEKKQYDIVLCDYNLGTGKDGQQVLEEARQRRLINIASVFIMITAENTREMVMGAVEYEPDSYLSKPFSKDLLRTRLEKILQKKADLAPVNAALEKQAYDQAIRLIDERIEKRPKNLADLTKLKADVCLQSGNYDAASQIYERVLANRDIPWARLGLGKQQFLQKRYAEAEATFRYLIDNVSTLTAAYDWLAKTQQALGDRAAAQKTLETAVGLSPKAIKRQQTLGELAMQNKDVACAEKSFNDAVKLGRHSVYNHPSMHVGLARAKTAAGKTDEATEVIGRINKAFDDSPEARFFSLAATAEVKQAQGDSAGAETAFEAASTLFGEMGHSRSPQIGLDLARTAAELGKTEQANALLKTAIQNNHDDEEFIARATEVMRSTGDADNAHNVVQAIRQEIIDMNNKGVRLLKTGKFDAAIELFEQAAEGMPTNKVINLNAARAMILKMEKFGLDHNQVAKIRNYIERTKQFAPDDLGLQRVAQRYQRLVLKT